MNNPTSLDIFEDSLYWLTRDSGDVWRHDKFGRGVSVKTRHGTQMSTALKIYHPLRYNTTSKQKSFYINS